MYMANDRTQPGTQTERRVLKFYPGESEVVVDTPEALAQAGIQMYAGNLDQVWGPGSAERYMAARGLKHTQQQG
jgi:hypothetical protein